MPMLGDSHQSIKKGFSTYITFGFPFGFPLPSGNPTPAGFSGSFVFVCQLGWETANKLEKSCESLGYEINIGMSPRKFCVLKVEEPSINRAGTIEKSR